MNLFAANFFFLFKDLVAANTVKSVSNDGIVVLHGVIHFI